MSRTPRRIVQMAVAGHLENSATQSEYTVLALADDGSLWFCNNRDLYTGPWRETAALPDKEESTDATDLPF